VVREYREIWAVSRAVIENNSMPEEWDVHPDTAPQWSFCAVAPLVVAFQGLAGIRPLEPGYRRVEIRPQLADLSDLELVTRTPQGPIRFEATGKRGDRRLSVSLPAGVDGELVVPVEEQLGLTPLPDNGSHGTSRYRLPPSRTTRVHLKREHG